jgi:NADH dehydrogenase
VVERPSSERVVIVGGGFAGLATARSLSRKLVDVVLVDQHNFHTFQPLLYQVATAGLEPADVAYPVRTIFGRSPNITFRHGKVTAIDLDARKLAFSDGTNLAYDQLVLASGATAGYYGIPGARDHARPLYTLSDARRLRNHLLGCLEAADARPEDFDGGAPVFVIVGGGPTGVETAGALVELLDVSVRRDRLRIDPKRTRVVLVDSGDSLLAGFTTTARRYAEQTLRARGVEVRLSSTVAEVTANGVRLSGGEWIKAAAVVWASGVTVNGTLGSSLGLPSGAGGRLEVQADLSLAGHPEVFVVGDAAAVPSGGRRSGPCPQLAPVAIQSGTHVGRQILRRTAGETTEPFTYRDKGIMATIGRRAAVAQLWRGPVLRGTLGWLAWLALHLVYLVGFRNRLVVLVNWAWRYLDWPSGPRLIVADLDVGSALDD